MNRISEQEGKIGNLESICPNCNSQLEKFPLGKTICRICGGEIYSRTRPFDLQKVLLNKSDADKIEYQWAVENDSGSFETLKGYYEEKDREKRVAEKLRVELGREPSGKELRREITIVGLFENRRETLVNYSEMGVKKVQILAANDCCRQCRKINTRIYPIKEAPNPPVIDCEDEWCRCTYIAVAPF